MKFNTTLFICLIFSTICITKAEPSDEVEEEATQEVEEEATQDVKCYAPQPFQYKPSERLKTLESGLSAGKMKFVPEGKVRETMTNVYQNAITRGAANEGLQKLDDEWKSMLQGPEASRVVGTCGRNFAKVVSSDKGREILKTVWITAHLLLSKAGKDTRGAGLGRIMASMFKLFESPQMPEIVSQTGGLIISAANKPRAVWFVRRAFQEIEGFLVDRDLPDKINTFFENMMSMMKNLKIPERESASSFKRTRSRRKYITEE
ncbi:Hypothetical protein CINCED_3A004380 [Cinara cedri]|uniref:Uncharacterized protein n=1 Tax=Cinara cedri TaxID=506608 RepID=A0A5E4N149_9HEMI|nr:Hypothetical protein CINCED_3A004380 [Cinara cedri]